MQAGVWAFGQILILLLLLTACETLASVLTSVSLKDDVCSMSNDTYFTGGLESGMLVGNTL